MFTNFFGTTITFFTAAASMSVAVHILLPTAQNSYTTCYHQCALDKAAAHQRWADQELTGGFCIAPYGTTGYWI